jgi:ubiquinone/menaquinone biosynthesis C-methylase UbiE
LQALLKNTIQTPYRQIKSYQLPDTNLDKKTVQSFGVEWTAFNGFSDADIASNGIKYFDIVTPAMLDHNSVVMDIGCGTGRYIKYLKGRFKHMVGIDPSAAIFAADRIIGNDERVELIQASTDTIPFEDNHFDFAYSLGVLHHIPDTQQALVDSVKKLKPGGYFLLYLYYSLDNRSIPFKFLFSVSNIIRKFVSSLPSKPKKWVCDILAIFIYMPFVLLCRALKKLGFSEKVRSHLPLKAYEDQSSYIIRNDSLDRFGTPLEQRFSKKEIAYMMENAGLTDLVFSDKIPYWHAVGRKK